MGHQKDDQIETILKRVLEGAHWTHFTGLKSENWLAGLRVLRPLLGVTKSDIYQFLKNYPQQGFEDAQYEK